MHDGFACRRASPNTVTIENGMTQLKPVEGGIRNLSVPQSEAPEWPTVTIAIPLLNEACFIEQTLDAVYRQDYPPDRMEVIIADGMSSDGTRDIVVAYSRRLREQPRLTPPLRLIDNPGRIVSTGLNAAIQAATGEYIVRVDGHTIIEPDYVRQCVMALQRSAADGVGGRMRAVGRGYIAEAIAIATSSRFGIGNSLYRTRRFLTERAAETTHMGAYRRDTLLRVGLFNEHFIRHQDYELDYRIRQLGGSILLAPNIRSHYFVRGNLHKLARQYFQYGFWKGRMLRNRPQAARLRHLVPPLFVLTLFVTALFTLAGSAFAGPLLGLISMLYLLFIVAGSIVNCGGAKGRWKYLPVLPIIFMCLHLNWGSGLWLGIVTPERLSPRWWPR